MNFKTAGLSKLLLRAAEKPILVQTLQTANVDRENKCEACVCEIEEWGQKEKVAEYYT